MPIFVALGIHIVDVLLYPVTKIPGGQALAFVEQVRTTVAGSAAGTAIDMAKLGLKVHSIGAIGEDSRGDFLISTMQKFGVNTSGIVRKPQVETSCSVLPNEAISRPCPLGTGLRLYFTSFFVAFAR